MAFIKAISYFLPSKEVSNEVLSQRFPEWSAEKVAQKVGVESRRVTERSETASDLAFEAANKLFKEYDIDRSTIDFLLLCTQSPDYFLPSSSCILQSRLNLPTSIGALDFNLGCSGCIYGLALAKGLVDSGISKNVLLLTAETYTKYIHPDDKGNLSIFGDGAAACLISDNGFAKIGDFVFGTDGEGAEYLIVKSGAARLPDGTGNSCIDEEGHMKYDDFLYMNGGKIFNFTLDAVPSLMTEILNKNQLNVSSIDFFIFHQANKFMLNTIRKVCAIPKDKFYIDLRKTGNTVSSTVLIGLKNCIDNKLIHENDIVMITGFGVGLSWAGTILKF